MTARDKSGERYLVTGSEGCIGSWVVRRLLAEGAAVVACDLAPAPLRIGRIVPAEQLRRLDYVVLDLTEPLAIDRLIARQGTTRIVHLAALQVPYVAADPLAGAEVNIVGTARILEAARRAETVRGISYASSSAVFARTAHGGGPTPSTARSRRPTRRRRGSTRATTARPASACAPAWSTARTATAA